MKNESVKKSHEKSKNVLEEKRKMVKRKICVDQHVYNNCYDIRSRAIKNLQPLNANSSESTGNHFLFTVHKKIWARYWRDKCEKTANYFRSDVYSR